MHIAVANFLPEQQQEQRKYSRGTENNYICSNIDYFLLSIHQPKLFVVGGHRVASRKGRKKHEKSPAFGRLAATPLTI